MTGVSARGRRYLARLRGGLEPLLLLFGLLALQAWDPAPIQALRLKVFDAYQRLAPGTVPAEGTLIVDIDDASIREIGQWPWDRGTVARLIAAVAAGEPSAIGLDIVFPEADRLAPASIKARLAPLLGADLSPLDRLPDTDAALRDTIAAAPVVAALAAADVPGAAPDSIATFARLGGDPLGWLTAFTGALGNLPQLTASARGVGNITVEPGIDGVTRQLPMLVAIGGKIAPALALEMLRVGAAERTYAINTRSWGVASVIVGEQRVPLDGRGHIWIRYAHHDPARFIPARNVLNGKVDGQRFAGRNVLIGSSAFGLWDLKVSPFGYSMPGVEIQAQVLDGIAAGTHLYRPQWMPAVELLATLASGLLAMTLVARIGARWTLAAHAGVMAMVTMGSWLLFREEGVLVDATYPAAAATLVYLTLLYGGHVRAESGRTMVTTAFKKYLSPALVERLAAGHSNLRLGGETRELTVLFADIRGFTALSEWMSSEPQRLTRLVNILLDRMSQAILTHGGTIDKFMGDNVMAFWNAPLDQPDHAKQACLAAIAIQESLATLNEELRRDPAWTDFFGGERRLAAGIGIHTGNCVVGNFGSSLRFDYSAIGDNVNQASRLEGAAKRYSIVALISDRTQAALDESIATLPVGDLQLRGRNAPVGCHVVIDRQHVAEDFKAAHTRFLDAATAADMEAAAHECVSRAPALGDLYVALYRERSERLTTFADSQRIASA